MQPQYTPALPIEILIPHIDASGDCWEWIGTISPEGYGYLGVKIDGKWRNRRAHRLVWTALCGPIPGNLPLDHLCRRRSCVNPDHLEPVPIRVNVLRGFGTGALHARRNHCASGHELVIVEHPRRGKKRHCLICQRAKYPTYPSWQRIRVTPMIQRTCALCRVEFQVSTQSVRRGGGIYCSMRCVQKSPEAIHRRAVDNPPRGEDAHQSRLTEKDVRAIRRRYSNEIITTRELAREYGVHHTVIVRAINRQTWSHVA